MVRKGYVQTEEHKKNVKQALKEYYLSPASLKTRRKLSQAVRSRPPISNETRERMSKAQILRYQTKPHAKPNLGRHLPLEWCSKISKGLKQFYSKNEVWNKGVKHSEATKQKIRDKMLEY